MGDQDRTMTGVCFLFTETGTEGGWWAMNEDGFLDKDGVHWTYEGLRLLEEGDEFTVFADDGSVLWHGIIRQDTTTGLVPHAVFRGGKWVIDRKWKQQVVGGFWVHWVQAGIDPEVWGKLFEGDKRCRLVKPDQTNEVPGLMADEGKIVGDIENSIPAADWEPERFKEELGYLGYPGFAYLALVHREVNATNFVRDALSTEDLDQRVVEALPWVLANKELNWRRLIEELRSCNVHNRLGFLLEVTVKAAKKLRLNETVDELLPLLTMLRVTAAREEDTLCHGSLTLVERKSLRQRRSQTARSWNILSDLTVTEVAKLLR
jgi:hypothetical protein